MTTSSTNAGFNINNTGEKGAVIFHRRLNVFLALGILCYITALVLSYFQNEITSSFFIKQLGSSLAAIADYLWSISSAVITIPVFFSILWLYYYAKNKGKPGKHPKWFIHFPSFSKFSLLFLFFIFTLFPLRWAQRSFTRSLESFPNFTIIDFILAFLSLAGTILCCLYCFEKLPLKIVTLIEKVTLRFFKWRKPFFIASLLMISLLATGIIAYIILDHIPHVQDSIAQLFQAKIFKMGKLYAPLPSHKEFFDYSNIINDDKWYSQYTPGHPLLLMLGLYLGVPWLIGPFLGTLSLLIFFLVIKTIYSDRRMLYLSCSLLLLSPFFLFMSSNHMNHSSTMFFILLFVFCYLRMFSSDSFTYAVISGLSLGYAMTIRPLTAVAIGTPFVCYLLYCTLQKREINIKKSLSFFAAVSLMALLLLLYNTLTNGHPFLFGYQQKYQTLGFLGSAQFGPSLTLKGGVINTSNNLIGLNLYLFEWPLPSLIFTFILFAIPVRKNRWDYLFLFSSLTLIVSYFFYYYQDLCFGPRFYYSITPFIVILSMRGFLELPHWLEEKRFDKRKTKASLYLLLFLCFLYSFAVPLPSLIKKYSNDYSFVTDKIQDAVQKQRITNAVIFIDTWFPPHITKPNLILYGSGFQFNSPDLHGEIIYALDLKDRNSELMKDFPSRKYYLCKFYSFFSDFKLLKLNEERKFKSHTSENSNVR
ncbi:MAG: hypothetical protein V3R78_01640 [Thermodesulfobacteriota bacterium]